MRHRTQDKKLGRSLAHRSALVSALVCALVEEKRIKTTLAKAKVARRAAEKLVTVAHKGTLAARRQAIAALRREDRVVELFDKIAPQFKGRPGGCTRIMRLGRRRSDGSEMALLEWVGIAPADKKKKKKTPEDSEAKPKT
jgi:large subunit ribosomal protein L17